MTADESRTHYLALAARLERLATQIARQRLAPLAGAPHREDVIDVLEAAQYLRDHEEPEEDG